MVVKKRNITVEVPVYDSEGILNKDPITSYYKVLSRYTAPTRYPATADQVFYPRGRTPQSLDNHVFFSPADNQTGYTPDDVTPVDGKVGISYILAGVPLTVEPPGSLTINWSWGGYEFPQGRLAFARTNQEQATKFNTDYRREGNLPANTDTRRIKGNYNSLTAPASLVDRPFESSKDFNMAQELVRLAEDTLVARVPADGAPVNPITGETYQLPQDNLSTGDINDGENSYLQGIDVNGNKVRRQIAATGYNGSVPVWLTRNPVELDDGTVRNAQNALEVQRIIERLHPGTDIPRRAALGTYSSQIYLTQSMHSYKDFEFYDFQVGSSFVNDWLTHKAWNEAVTRTDSQGRRRTTTDQRRNANNESRIPEGLAYINPEYNYFNRSYEEAISQNEIPESILPNMYIYELANGGNGFNINETPEWQGTERSAEELQGNYDTLITLDEFDRNILPRSDDDDFSSYFTRYAEATKGQALTVDMYTNLNRFNSRTMTPAGDMDIYPKFNNVKHAYPMYIEINLPTPPLGTFGTMMQRSDLSAPFISSLQDGGEMKTHNHTCDSYFAPAGIWRQRAARTVEGQQLGTGTNKFDLFADRMSSRFLKWNKASIHTSTRVLDFNAWLDGLDTEALVAVLSSNGNDLPVGVEDVQACLNRRSQLMVRQIRNSMARIAEKKMVKYQELLVQRDHQNRQEKTFCEAETIIYRIEKKTSSGNRWEKIQEYFLPNTDYVDVLDFVDTQVKYNTMYRYEVYAYAVVYGSTFRFRCREYQVGPGLRQTPNGQTTPIYFSYNVETMPNIKVVEYPVFTKGGEDFTTWSNVPKQFPGNSGEFTTAGLTYPDVKVLDRPPCPPEITILPFRDDYTQIMFNMQPQTGQFIGDRALKFIPLSEEEEEEFSELADYQKRVENYGLRAGHLEFRSEGAEEIDRMEIFRTDELKTNPTDEIDLYSSFSDKLHKVLDISPENNTEESENALGFDCIDTLEPNKKYYYTCRALDRHGHKSNPSVIYQVELLYDNGFYSPRMSIYSPTYQNQGKPNRSFSRFIEIRAADIQVEPFNLPTVDENGNETPNYKKGLIEDEADEKVENSAFIVRITSKDTGRKIDLKFRFKSSTRNGNT